MTTIASGSARAQRRAVSRAARDAFPPMGVYAIRDHDSGCVRIGASRNVDAALARIAFELRLGTHPDKALQAAYRRSGAGRFTFEVLTLLKQRDDPAFDYGDELRAMAQLYREDDGVPRRCA